METFGLFTTLKVIKVDLGKSETIPPSIRYIQGSKPRFYSVPSDNVVPFHVPFACSILSLAWIVTGVFASLCFKAAIPSMAGNGVVNKPGVMQMHGKLSNRW